MKAEEAIARLVQMREQCERIMQDTNDHIIEYKARQDGQALNFAISLIESILHDGE